MTENQNSSDTPELRKVSDEELRLILENHEEWIKTNGYKGKQADLRNTDLEGRDFCNANLREVNFKNALLWGVNFKKAFLKEANFQKARLGVANFQKAYLGEANLRKANLTGANLRKANLGGANLQKAKLDDANLQKVNLSLAKLQKANLLRANLQRAILVGTNFQKAILVWAKLQKANLLKSNLQKANFANANLQEANLSEVDLRFANMRNANFRESQVSEVKYKRARGKYRGIRVATCYGSERFKRLAQDQAYIDELAEGKWWEKCFYYIWLIFADCGRTPWYWMAWSAAFAIGFGLIFHSLGAGAFDVKHIFDPKWLVMIYYSVVTFTTLGFGDVVPKTATAAIWVMAEVIIGYLMLGGLISILATIIARRS